MKKILILLCLIIMAHPSHAQLDMIQRNRNLNVKLTLKDAKTSEPISWASVYLIPDGDTTITHFALSDDKGDVLIKEVPTGKYELNAEMIGYIPHKKVYTFKGWEYDCGIIKLEENAEYIDAATISAKGNPIVVKKDTIEFNASAFNVGENAMLEDLLKKMPGMEVSEDGSVTINGETVDKITVGGKTFFFNDPNAALKNLPAKIVDKIKVVDKTKDEASVKGIITKDDKEKVMDVELKEQYTKGWYGNAKLGGGASLAPESENGLTDDRKVLYNGNIMATGYTEKDQVVLIGNAYNAPESGGMIFYSYGGDATEKSFNNLGGLDRIAKAGVNYNTERIKGMEASSALTYSNKGKIAKQLSSRTTFKGNGNDLVTANSYAADGIQNNIDGSVRIVSKKNDKYHLSFAPTIGYVEERITASNASSTSEGDKILNTSQSSVFSESKEVYARAHLYGGFKKLGKERRTLSGGLNFGLSDKGKDTKEYSEVSISDNKTIKDLTYAGDISRFNIGGHITYSEPIAEKWTIQASVNSDYSENGNTRKAFNADNSRNDYYSSFSYTRYMSETGSVAAQWSNDTSNVQFGLTATAVLNEVKAKSLGVETITGEGEWLMNWAPYLSYEYEKNATNIFAGYYGYSSAPSSSLITPALDISDPIQITAGNIYLKPSYRHGLYSSIQLNNRETFAFLNVHLNGSMITRNTVYASWTDADGVRYAIPVNAQRPSSNGSAYVSYNRPLGKERKFTMTISGNVYFTGAHSYQAKSSLDGLDLDNFDYNTFMKSFWGNSRGDLFYSGESGFAESRTNTLGLSASLQFKYSIDKLDISVGGRTSNSRTRYSLDPTANMNTWDNRVFGDIIYQPGKDWELKTDLSYRFYFGYSDGYGKPEWAWNMSIGKSIKAVTLELKAIDILNQRKSLKRTTSAEYMEDVYSNILGRRIMLNLTFNFGKMNAKKNSKVERAMWNML